MKKCDFSIYFILFIVIFFILLTVPLLGDQENQNLLINGNFEDGNLNGWESETWNEGGTIETTETYIFKGKYSCKIFSGTIENDMRLAQEIPVEPDTYYMLSGWIAAEDVQEGKIGANISIIGGFHYTGNVEGTKRWKYYELKFKTSKSHHYLKVAARLGMYYNTVTGTAYFDDLKLEKLTFTPRYCVVLQEPKDNHDSINKNKKTEQTKTIKRVDTIFGKINFPLIGILMVIGLILVILNIFFTIFREKNNAHRE